jgi:tetratricopeptide (TPR) repeat protein
VWPVGLAFFYERFPVQPASLWPWLAPLAALGITIALVVLARRSRGPLAVWLIFAGTLVPVLGFVNVEWFVFAFVADHFQYVANIALFVGIAAVVGRFSWSRLAVSAMVAGLALLTWRQSATFSSNVAVYANAVARSPGSAVAHNHYGLALAKIPARQEEAVAQFAAALRINPDAAEVHANLGELLLPMPERHDEALAHLETAMRLKPQLLHVRRLLAAACFDRGKAIATDPARAAEAAACYERALAHDPDFVEAHYNLGNVLLRLPGRERDAQREFEAALRLKPDFPEAHTNLGTLLARQPGRLREAIAHFEAALRVAPNFMPARNNLDRANDVLLRQSSQALP